MTKNDLKRVELSKWYSNPLWSMKVAKMPDEKVCSVLEKLKRNKKFYELERDAKK